jgi:SSS family solute:Na+ symporter/sodium/pantothenate symporter
MHETTIPWLMFLIYCVAISGLTWWNRRKATSMEAFAVGSRRVPPFFIGLSLAANMTSVATFVINPGLVHAFGWAGVVGYGFAAPAGIFIGLIVVSKQFRRVGDRFTVLTVPSWIGSRYGDRRLTLLFSVISLLQVTFLVLIVVALVRVLTRVLEIGMWPALVLVIGFTFGYMLLGGAAVHVWSNSVQALVMMAVAVLLVVSGIHLFVGDGMGFFDRLAAVGPHYGSMVNPDSALFRDFFEVIVANFLIGIAIIMQPHIVSKALYLRTERDVNAYLATAMVAGTIFTSVLIVGLYSRLELGGAIAPDAVVADYIATVFSPGVRALVMLGVLAAGFSTLEGVILALSSIFANDLWATSARIRGLSDDVIQRRVLKVGRWFLVGLAPVTLILAWWQLTSPTLSVAIFAQNGIYGLFAATFAPVLFGIFSDRAGPRLALAAAITALVVHFGLYYSKLWYYPNPAVPAACALVVSTLIMAVGVVAHRR